MGDRSKDTPAVSEPEVLDDDADLADDAFAADADGVVVEEVDESAFALPETSKVLPAAGKDTALAPSDPLQRYLAEVRRYPFLTKEEELHLFNDFQVTGNRESAVKLIVSNLRVAVTIAAEYLHSGADYLDLIQEGNVGLMQAIKKFDPTKGSRFHSYAAWWVRAYILRYLLNTYRMVKIGTTQDQRKLFYNLNKEKRKLEREGFAPDTKMLADRLHVRERDVIEMGQRLGSWDLSLDAPMGPDQ
ncbi:MAG: sigma-70 family RNA polymerase sigma factor, partial [Nitrospirota bacterium]